MKKLLILFIIAFLISPLCLFADEEAEADAEAEETEVTEEDLAITPEKRGFLPVRERRFEIGLLHTRIGFANSFLSTSQVFKKNLVINLDDLGDGFKVNFDLGLSPLFFNYFSKDRQWGFGLNIGVDAVGALDLSGDMLNFNNAKDAKSDIAGAAFIDIKALSFFHVKKINTKFKANLSVFYPVMYVDPDISYSLSTGLDNTTMDLNYKIKIYTPMSLEDGGSSALSSVPGVDISLGAEYPLAEVLGLKEKFNFLDFIVGVDLINIPLAPASMKEYMLMSGRIGKDEPIDFDELDDIIDTNSDEYGQETIKIFRPFKMHTWADWKPFDFVPVSFIPTIGFAVNPMYTEPGSIEAGVKARFDLANLLIATVGTGYYDRMWKNGIDVIFNLRVFELSFGFDLRSQDFVKSWSGGGFGMNFGIKFGG